MELVKGMWRSISENDEFTKKRGFGGQVITRLGMAERFITSYYHSRSLDEPFREIKTYCMFLGHARSGGSVIGALLDAHPNVVLADEADTFRFIFAGFSRNQIFHQLITRSRQQTYRGRFKAGRDAKTYSYLVPGQWQGRFEKLQVIGNSKAGISTQRIAQDPLIVKQLLGIMNEIPVKFVVTIRNPYDTISTMKIRSERPLEQNFERYFSNCEAIRTVQEMVGCSNLCILKHETFIDHPGTHLREVLHFLGIEAADDYIRDCVSIIYKSPSKSRQKVQWSAPLIDAVKDKIDEFDFLQGYSFEG